MIDVEIARRKLLEDVPIPTRLEDPVNFDTSEIPWWAWVKRFHLPEVGGWAHQLYYARLAACSLPCAVVPVNPTCPLSHCMLLCVYCIP